MTETERLIFKDHVQQLALSMLQNDIVSADTNVSGVVLTIRFDGLGEATLLVPWPSRINSESGLQHDFIVKAQLQNLILDLCRAKYFRKE